MNRRSKRCGSIVSYSMRLLLVLAFTLLAGSARAGSRLAELGGQIKSAMPGLTPTNLFVPGYSPLTTAEAARLSLPDSAVPYPAAWNPERAAVLLERAEAEAGASKIM